jgi:hypothetical protein
MNRNRVLATSLILVCALYARCTLQRGLSTPDERANVVELTRSLERNPLAAKASASGEWIRRRVIEIPEIKFYWCEPLLGRGLGPSRTSTISSPGCGNVGGVAGIQSL